MHGIGGAGQARSVLLTLLLAVIALPAQALKFSPHSDGSGRVLLVHDCHAVPGGDRNCAGEHERRFTGPGRGYPGDAAVLDAILSRQRFDEVHLVSGGGNLDEGIKVGEVLRRHQATVRVPRGGSCVSACTVAFMGGLFRIVDDGAEYKVHAYSRFLGGLPPPMRAAIASDPGRELERFARDEYQSARRWAARLHGYFQRMVNGQPAPGAAEAVLERRAAPQPPYVANGQAARDAERVAAEGGAAAHEVVMAIERESMAAAIADLQPQVADLGPRAGPALRMLETMFTSRILGTATLSRETLLQLGFVTPIVSQQMESR